MSTAPLYPFTLSLTREIADFPIGNILLLDHRRRVISTAAVKVNPDEWPENREAPVLFTLELNVIQNAWFEMDDVVGYLNSGKNTLVDADGNALAWEGDEADTTNAFVAKKSYQIRYPWELLRANEQFISSLTQREIAGEVHPFAVIEGTVHIGQGTRILPGVFIEGNVIIGKNCKIGPNCYIRGNTSIGDNCHIGQSVEIKNCLILSNTNVGHLSYIGDSVLGEKVNLGAGTTTSNLRHDGKNHRSMVDGVLIDTGRRKFGAIIGDGVHTGINTSIYPGRKLWPNTSTRPGEIVQQDVK